MDHECATSPVCAKSTWPTTPTSSLISQVVVSLGHPSGVKHRFSRLRDRAGLRGVRLHDLRHSAATRMLAGGVSVKTDAGRLGHANASMTLNVYSHFLQASDREAADLLGRVLDGN
jgi:integrase